MKISFFLLILIDLAAASICNINPDLRRLYQLPHFIDFFNNFLYNNNIKIERNKKNEREIDKTLR